MSFCTTPPSMVVSKESTMDQICEFMLSLTDAVSANGQPRSWKLVLSYFGSLGTICLQASLISFNTVIGACDNPDCWEACLTATSTTCLSNRSASQGRSAKLPQTLGEAKPS